MQPKNYTKTIPAVFFDGKTDVQQIANWCGGMVVELVDQNTGKLRTDAYFIDIPGPHGIMTAGPNHYIFEDQGAFFAMTAADFKQMVD